PGDGEDIAVMDVRCTDVKEEHVVGLNCIASAIYDDVGSVVAAISISGPSSRLTEDRFVSQGELVRDTARDISTALGLKAHP
ncbi:IclR family transcriptional regulator domain-containing protein, partial [Escherichia sp. R-CC3]